MKNQKEKILMENNSPPFLNISLLLSGKTKQERMEPDIYIEPFDDEIFKFDAEVDKARIANIIRQYNKLTIIDQEEGLETKELKDFDFALIGVPEDRRSLKNKGAKKAPDKVREYFYALFSHWKNLHIVDMGNLKTGNTLEDTYFALKEVITHLLENNVLPIIIGGTQDLTYANYLAYQPFNKIINITSVDSVFDLGHHRDNLNTHSWLSKIILHQPNFLFNFTNVGYQSYLVNKESVQLMKDLFFDAVRLGEVRANLEEAEPMVRNADILSFDISAIRQADAPGCFYSGPNGFTGEEACAITRYAGLSDKLTSIGFYGLNPQYDNRGQTAHLVAQMIWYFIDGYQNRIKDLPYLYSDDYIKFTVTNDSAEEDLVFLKSKKTGRWWMVLKPSNLENNTYRPHQFIPCTYSDYQLALKNEIPDRWWKAQQKMM
jgi:arginase family enzyme